MTPCRGSLWLTLCVSAIVQLPTAATQRDGPGAASEPEAPIVLGTDGGNYSIATAVNNRRQVVGRILVGTDDLPRPFLWEDGVMRDLGTPGGPSGYGGAIDINDRGQVVGVTVDGDNPPAATLWQDGQVVSLERLPGSYSCTPTAINNRGLITGNCVVAGDVSNEAVAVVWTNGVPARLALPTGVQALPRDVNDARRHRRHRLPLPPGIRSNSCGGRASSPTSRSSRAAASSGSWASTAAASSSATVRAEARSKRCSGMAGRPRRPRRPAWSRHRQSERPWRRRRTQRPAADRVDEGRTAIELAAPSVGYVSIPVAINEHGDVVANAVIGFYDFQSVAVLWPRATHGR